MKQELVRAGRRARKVVDDGLISDILYAFPLLSWCSQSMELITVDRIRRDVLCPFDVLCYRC